MKREPIYSNDTPRPIGPYSPAIVTDHLIFCAGQTPVDPATGQLVSGGVLEQTARALENLSAVLKAAGFSLNAVVKTTVFLISMSDFAAMNEVYARYFPDVPPARTTVAVAGLPRGARVEIECIALAS
ncbi:MAG TPA: Rid family detoxifying hydrolase [Ktedonobacterales bacterium]|nr:Rid family detoxifying hydrolase [Ktedonobacterales bacterium]